jgi:hypothetical protein
LPATANLTAGVPTWCKADHAQGLQIALDALDDTAAGLDLLTEQLGGLPGGDAVQRTAILDRISALYTDINRLRADARSRKQGAGLARGSGRVSAPSSSCLARLWKTRWTLPTRQKNVTRP